MKKIRPRRKFLRINTPMSFGILCALLLILIGGGTYAKSLPNILAFGPIFPGDEVREHKPDEFIEIPKLMKNAQIIASAMYEMAK